MATEAAGRVAQFGAADVSQGGTAAMGAPPAGALRCGPYAEASRFATLGHDRAPLYEPALRFLAALRHHQRDDSGAADLLRRLQRLEPGFSLPPLLDNVFPMPSLRDTPLIAIA